MDWIIGVTVAALGLAVFLYLHFSESPLSQRFRRRWPTLTQKVTMALLLGFCAGIASSPRGASVLQKIIVVLVSAALIWAMSIHPGDEEPRSGC